MEIDHVNKSIENNKKNKNTVVLLIFSVYSAVTSIVWMTKEDGDRYTIVLFAVLVGILFGCFFIFFAEQK